MSLTEGPSVLEFHKEPCAVLCASSYNINDLHMCCLTLKYVDDGSVWEICASDCHDSHLQEATEQAKTWSS